MAEIEKFEGDIFWNDDNTENTCEPDDELDNVGEDAIVEFQQAKRLVNFFGVLVNGKPRYFDTQVEAEEVSAPIPALCILGVCSYNQTGHMDAHTQTPYCEDWEICD